MVNKGKKPKVSSKGFGFGKKVMAGMKGVAKSYGSPKI